MFNDRAFLKIVASLIITALLSLALSSSVIFALDDEALPDNEGWSSVESNFFVLYYDPSANLEDLERELTKRPLYFDQQARYGEVTTIEEICQRLDKLYNRVQDVLDMHPKTPRIKIKIFRDRDGLNGEFVKIFDKQGDFKSFYVYKYNTIYTSESDIEDSVIIHEMAHAIIDHYFSVIPPETVGEILAAYVDAHLEG
ncbi:MAG: hypothetical protein NTY34_00280 [Candidatus Omnitrophica bacterium]|nr:hypothetical protein [Candidatus Omnitrophota bacterium]